MKQTMITITTKLYDGSTYRKTVDAMATPLSGIGCFVDDVVFSTFMRSEVKSVNWQFIGNKATVAR